MGKYILYFVCCGIMQFFFVPAEGQIITTYAGNHTSGYSGDGGPCIAAEFKNPSGLRFHNGELYIADGGNYRVRKISAAGIITTVAGNGTSGYSGDGGPATAAELDWPEDLAFDNAGNMYICDEGNNRIRKISTAGIITTFAGSGVYGSVDSGGYKGDGGPATAAEFFGPCGIAADNAGNIYIADGSNARVRKVDVDGIITTFAGGPIMGGVTNGQPATAAQLQQPYKLVFDDAGNLYISCYGTVLKVNTSGNISTIAGGSYIGFSGDGGPAVDALLNTSDGLAFDQHGNLFIADFFNVRIRKIDTAGIITSVAGSGVAGWGAGAYYLGDGGPATNAKLYDPRGVAVDDSGNVLFSDSGNDVIRKIGFGSVTKPNITTDTILSFPNPVSADGILNINGIGSETTYRIVDKDGSLKRHGSLDQVNNTIDIKDLPTGIYIIQLTDSENDKKTVKILKQ